MPTYSESLFSAYLDKHNFAYSRPDEEDRNSTAVDFLITSNEIPIAIFEIKEMSDNPDDLEWKAKWEAGCQEMHEIHPIERVRKLIEGSRRQLKASQKKFPAISLIPTIYSTIGSGRMDDDTMDPALFGDRCTDRDQSWHWNGAYLQPKKNRYISGVAVLHGTYEIEKITIYHNPYAEVEIPKAISEGPLAENKYKAFKEDRTLEVGFKNEC